jgi:Asp-tRNA(Asn)/Glu-tRNA(Gln) amidotransferase A subunit family amidase
MYDVGAEVTMVDTYATARAMVADLQAKQISARELLTAHLAQRDKVAASVHAVIETGLLAAAVEDALGGFRPPAL